MLARAVILSEDGLVHCRNLPGLVVSDAQCPAATLPEALDQLESRLITEALSFHQGNMSKAASSLGISERVMGLRMKKFGLKFKDFRSVNKSQ